MYYMFIGAVLSGAVVGAIPAILGATKGKINLGLCGFAACLVGSILLGLILSVPICAVFIYLILKNSSDNTSSNSNVPNPLIEENKNNADIPSQIQKLSELKESGILTEEEFQEKKSQLLSKM